MGEHFGSPTSIFDAESRVREQQRELMAKAQRWQALDQERQQRELAQLATLFATSESPMDTLPDEVIARPQI